MGEIVILRQPTFREATSSRLGQNTVELGSMSTVTRGPLPVVLTVAPGLVSDCPFSVYINATLAFTNEEEAPAKTPRPPSPPHRALAPASASGQQFLASEKLDRI
jgi:hypothetical protein